MSATQRDSTQTGCRERRLRHLALAAVLFALPAAADEPAQNADAQAAHHHALEAGRPVHWGYQKDDGPARWAELSPSYELCESGKRQSPIDLRDATPADTSVRAVRGYEPATLAVAHHEHAVDVLDNGHTIQVTYDEGSTLSEGGTEFELVQYHFHAPSEHHVDGRSYPMEMHLVHKSDDGHLAVVGVLIETGQHNKAFDPIWGILPSSPGESHHAEGVAVNVDDLLPKGGSYYRYQGSLTTPPCSEGVRWFVLQERIALSKDQIGAFTSILHDNNRPVQPLEGRMVGIVK